MPLPLHIRQGLKDAGFDTDPGLAYPTLTNGLKVGDIVFTNDELNATLAAGDSSGFATGLTASTTQTQGGALALTARYNNVTTVANANDAVVLPAAVAGLRITIRNSGANTLQVFPATGGTIDGGSANASVTVLAGVEVIFTATTTTAWLTTRHDIGLSDAELNVLDGVTAGTVTASKAIVVDANSLLGGTKLQGYDKVAVAESTAGTGTTEAVFSTGTYTIAADRCGAGTVIEFDVGIYVTGQNSTDTQTFAVRLGGVAGDVIITTGAQAFDADESATLTGRIVVRTGGATGTCVANSLFAGVVATTPIAGNALTDEITGVDFTGDLDLVVTHDASTSDAGNTATLRCFNVRVYGNA